MGTMNHFSNLSPWRGSYKHLAFDYTSLYSAPNANAHDDAEWNPKHGANDASRRGHLRPLIDIIGGERAGRDEGL